MIVRIVKLSFTESFVSEFESQFPSIKNIVEGIEGCNSVILLKGQDHTYFTYSLWNSEADLEAYRNSITFQNIWAIFKPHFVAPAQAWTTVQIG